MESDDGFSRFTAQSVSTTPHESSQPPHRGRNRRKPVIGLVGGIGAGKTSVAQLLQALGAAVIDSDRLAHEELACAEVTNLLRQWWGDSILTPTGEVERKAVGAIVFSNPQELSRLEKLLYPRIETRRQAIMAPLEEDEAVLAIVLDAPKLLEAGLGKACDALIFVDAQWSVRVGRVARARGWAEDELRRRENLQRPLEEKRADADYVITNNSDIDALRLQVEQVFVSVTGSKK